MRRTPEGAQAQPEDKRILIKLFGRTLFMSLVITGACILLAYPVSLPAGDATDAGVKPADDPGAVALLDIIAGANLCVEGDAAATGCDQRNAGLAWAGGR